MLAARDGLGHESQRRLPRDEIIDEWIQAAMAARADDARRRGMLRKPLVGGFAVEEGEELLDRLVHQIDERIGIAQRRGGGSHAKEDLPLALDFRTVAVESLQVRFLHIVIVTGNAPTGSARLGELCAFLAVERTAGTPGEAAF